MTPRDHISINGKCHVKAKLFVIQQHVARANPYEHLMLEINVPTGFPYPFSSNPLMAASGAMYARVPQKVFKTFEDFIERARPINGPKGGYG